jgi:prefoldin alpha subunit
MDKQVTTSQISQFLKIIQTEQNELQVAKKELNFQITELDLIIKNLRTEFPNQFQKKLVPFGSFAFMKGSVSETKLITVFLGDDWFVKVTVPQGIEILERRKGRIEEKMVLIDEELNQLKAKIQTTEGLLTGNMLGVSLSYNLFVFINHLILIEK